ncbi:unnamed protein product, partial [Chrysoparadoxa australica]
MYAVLAANPSMSLLMPFLVPGTGVTEAAAGSVSLPDDPEPGGEQPTYVNAKQYNRIMMRRKVRAKLKERREGVATRKPFQYKSRHEHACKRLRGEGGKFLSKEELEILRDSGQLEAAVKAQQDKVKRSKAVKELRRRQQLQTAAAMQQQYAAPVAGSSQCQQGVALNSDGAGPQQYAAPVVGTNQCQQGAGLNGEVAGPQQYAAPVVGSNQCQQGAALN